MDQTAEISKADIDNGTVRMTALLPNEEENEEEAPIDFGIEPTPILPTVRKPIAPRNLKKDKNKCCVIL